MAAENRVLLNKSQYAAHRGVTPQMVSNWIAAGKVKIVKGKVDRDASDKFLDATLDPFNGGKKPPKGKFAPPPEDDGDYGSDGQRESVAELKIRRERVLLKQAEMEYEKAAGKLCVVERATHVIVNNITAAVSTLQRMPDRISSRIAAVTGMGEREVRQMLREEITDVCKEISAIGESFPESLTSTEQ